MSFYVAAYDTEAVYPWWEKRTRGFDYAPSRVRDFLAGVQAVVHTHLEREVPATFFLVAKMLELAGPELRALLDHPLFEIQCHTFTHPNLIELDERGDTAALRYELADAKERIEDTFGRPVIGLTAPGGHTRGFAHSGHHVGRRLPLCAQRGGRPPRHGTRSAQPAFLVHPGRLPRTARNPLACLA